MTVVAEVAVITVIVAFIQSIERRRIMRLIHKILAVLGLVSALSLSFFGPVEAQDYWYYVGADIHDNTTSIDNSSVDKDADVAQLWIRVIQPGADYYFEKMEIKKNERSIQTLDMQYFHATGVAYDKSEYTYDTKPAAVKPGTIGESLYNLVWGAQ